ncbi:MAG: hypothetical protein QOC81_4413 [Thermoanaerobaculia bacterium]|jgi:hypothetical protein|nr:hypothetical protein [Thermoanaerobaculia bacterium]
MASASYFEFLRRPLAAQDDTRLLDVARSTNEIDYPTRHMKDDTLSKISDLKDRLQSVRSYL